MNEEKKELFANYIKSNIAPILVDFINGSDIPNSIIVPATCNIEDLTGHYLGTEYVPPKWLNQLLKSNKQSILIIDKIDSIPKNEQIKFVEILKYRKVSTFEIPKDTIIIVTAKEINNKTISETIYSLVSHIW